MKFLSKIEKQQYGDHAIWFTYSDPTDGNITGSHDILYAGNLGLLFCVN
jgi:hypothetical protein